LYALPINTKYGAGISVSVVNTLFVATTVARSSPQVAAGHVLGGEHVEIVHVPAANLYEIVSVVDCTVVAAPGVAGTVVVELPALSIAIGANASPAGIVFPSASSKLPER
jgi:hypothetical protein